MKNSIFISYSHYDSPYRELLEKHLSTLRDNGKIIDWSDIKIMPGDVWDLELNKKLDESQIIILLVSPDFLSSKYIKQIELSKALERQSKSECKIIPIILRYCQWESSLIGKFQAIPSKNGKLLPIRAWKDRDEAFNLVTSEIDRVINDLINKKENNQLTALTNKKAFDSAVIDKKNSYSNEENHSLKVLPDKIILDRHYAYLLTAFCCESNPEDRFNFDVKYKELFEAISYCLIFFDKILIEQHHVSSISWNLSEVESKVFKDIFEPFTFDNEHLNPYENMLLNDMIKHDIENPDLNKILDNYYSKKNIKPKSYYDIIKYINNCIFFSEKYNACICPLPNRVPIYEFKFGVNNKFRLSQNTRTFINDSIEILIPEIKFYSLSELLLIKKKTSFTNFKNMIWRLSIEHLKSIEPTSTTTSLTQEFAKSNFDLITELQFKNVKRGHFFATGNNAIPISKEMDLPKQMEESIKKNHFNWLFFIYDIKANTKGNENAK